MLRIGASCALALLVITCTEQTLTGPNGTGVAALNFSAFATTSTAVQAESLEITLQRPADASVALDSVLPLAMAANGDSAVVKLTVVLRQTPEDFLLSVRVFGAGITWYTGSSTIRLTSGRVATPTALVVQYVGPGAKAAWIALAPRDTTAVGGVPFPLQALVYDSGAQVIAGVPVAYRVSDPSLAAVTHPAPNTAVFTGKPGVPDSVWVVAETPTHLKDSTRVYIVPTIPVGTVAIVPKVDTIENGTTVQYTAIATDAAQNPLTTTFGWTSTDPSVATVSSTGLATAHAGDSTMIIASAGSVADTAWLYVRALQSITLSPSDTIVTAVGDFVDLTASVVYNFDFITGGSVSRPGPGAFGVITAAGGNIRFTSASPSVATVDRLTGRVTLIGPGDAVIVAGDSAASSDSLIRGFATLHVNQVTAGIVSSPKSPVIIGVDGKIQLTATAVDANGYPVKGKAFSWIARLDTITGGQPVSVTSTGLVTGVANGSAYVVASLIEDTTFKDSTEVIVSGNPPTQLRWAFDSITVGKGGTTWVGLSVTVPTTRDLTIEVKSSDDKIVVARTSTVTIPAGLSSTMVEVEGLEIGRGVLTAHDLGGPGPSYDDAVMTVEVASTDLPSLMLNSDISLSIGKAVQTYVRIPFPAPADVTVSLDGGLLLDVPKTVTIRKGTDVAYFDISALLLGIGILKASAPGYRDAAAVSIQIQLLEGL